MTSSKQSKLSAKTISQTIGAPAVVTTIGTIGGVSLGPLIVWLVAAIWDKQMPAEAAAALGALIAQAANYPLLRAHLRR